MEFTNAKETILSQGLASPKQLVAIQNSTNRNEDRKGIFLQLIDDVEESLAH
jgi:hypothetical protein